MAQNSFEPVRLLEMLRGSHVVFAGDSTSDQRMDALQCLAHGAGFAATLAAAQTVEAVRDAGADAPHRFGRLFPAWGIAEFNLTASTTRSHWLGLEATNAWQSSSSSASSSSPSSPRSEGEDDADSFDFFVPLTDLHLYRKRLNASLTAAEAGLQALRGVPIGNHSSGCCGDLTIAPSTIHI